MHEPIDQINKKSAIAWVMYDFANSAFTTLVVTFIYATYFTKAIAADVISGTAQWGHAVTITAITVALFSPILGNYADQYHKRKLFLCIFTTLAILSTAMLFFPLPGEVTKALTWFIIANIAFEMANVFYNSFLTDIAPAKKFGLVSGIGWGLGYFGGLAAMFIAMIGFVNPEIPWFGLAAQTGENIRATNLLVAAWFAIFSLPVFLFLKEKKIVSANQTKLPKKTLANLQQTFRDLLQFPQTVRFLIARLLYNDGLITIFAFGGIYAAGTFNFTFQEIMIFGIVLNIAAGFGSLVIANIDDKIGSKNTIMISLAGLTMASITAVLSPSKELFWAAGIVVGIFSGPNQAASRSLMAKFVPAAKESEFFGFFAFSGKFTAFLGPLLLSVFTKMFNSQRAGMSVIVLFFLVGALLLRRVDEERGMLAAQKTA